MDTSDYEQKMDELLNVDQYQILVKAHTVQTERNVYKCLYKCMHFFKDKIWSLLTPHYYKPPYVYTAY